MKHLGLQGWNISVEKTTIQEPKGGNGQMADAPGWILVFTEVMPPSGDTIRFAMGREARDFVVREMTGGIVLHGGELPSI